MVDGWNLTLGEKDDAGSNGRYRRVTIALGNSEKDWLVELNLPPSEELTPALLSTALLGLSRSIG
jgi:hypothetical protein